jgi:hypothetical protein
MLTHDWLSIVITLSKLTTWKLATWKVFLVLMRTMWCIICAISKLTLSFKCFLECLSPQELKTFHGLKGSERMPLCQKPKHNYKLQKFPFPFFNQICKNAHVHHYVLQLKKESFGICMLQVWRHISLPHNAIKFCLFTFAPPNMFIKIVKFENQKPLSPFNLCPCLTPYMHYPIKTKDNFYPWKFCCPIILELKFIRQHQLLQWSF